MSPLTVPARELLTLAADHVWQSTLFAAAAAVVAALFRRHSASLRYWVWLAASLKFLVPFAALVALGGYNSWRTVEIVPYRDTPLLVETVGRPFSQDAVTVRTSNRQKSSDALSGSVPSALLWIWAIGATVFLVRSVRQWFQVRQIVARSRLRDEGREVQLLRSLESSGPVMSGRQRKPLRVITADTTLEPGIFGVIRPVLLWPRGISERFTDAQLEAVLAHELCHLHRQDNLAALLQIAVQTIFWFHPLVWWIGARLITERERACDEAVLRRGSDREVYAESILKTCQFFVESPLACVAGVTGSDLKKRIEQIMTNESTSTVSLWNRALLTAAAIAAFVTPVTLGALNPPPQTRELSPPAALPAFEEVSVRPNPSPGPGGRGAQFQPARWQTQNVTLRTILKVAFAPPGSVPNSALPLADVQVSGGPEWVDVDKFDIVATTPASTQPTPPAQTRQMVQRMLAERFQLKAHWEKRDLPVYALSVAHPDGMPGPGLTRTSDDECNAARAAGPPPMPPNPGQPAPPPPCGAIQFGPGQLLARGAPMEWFASTLASVPVVTGIDRPVIDRTSLKGNFGFTLKFQPAGGANPDPERPQLVTALLEQLGLKLEATRAPLDVLVIDSAEKPPAN